MPSRHLAVPHSALRLPRFLAALSLIPAYTFAAASTPAPAPAAPAVEYRRASLVERQPFAKPERGPAKPTSGGPLELRGFFGAGPTLEVSLSRPDGKEAAWCAVGDKSSKWLVESADPDAGTADVRFDGMLLHLKLARPEPPSLTVTPAADTPPERPRDRRPGARLSPAGREAMRNVMREQMETARKEHPEYFDGSTLSPEQQEARSRYFQAGMAKAREAVAKVSPEDAAALANMPTPTPGSGRSRRDTSGASNGEAPKDAPPKDAPSASGDKGGDPSTVAGVDNP